MCVKDIVFRFLEVTFLRSNGLINLAFGLVVSSDKSLSPNKIVKNIVLFNNFYYSQGENPNFIVGDEAPDDNEDDGPSHEGRDSFPNAPPPNIRRMLTPAQQLALAEKRSKLR